MGRRLFLVGFFLFAFAFNMALAQNQTGAAAQGKGIVLESVDEDIVDDDDGGGSTSGGKDTSSTAAPQSAKQEKSDSWELDIDKLLADDDDGDLIAEEKPSVNENALADSVSVDSLIKSADVLPDSQAVAGANKGREQRRSGPAPKKEAADLGPAVIEDGRSINFAHNLSQYRSPKIAMLLSLILPGLGQAYSKSYIKAGAFGAAEIAAIGTAIYFNSAGKSKKKEAYRFADKNFSLDSLKKYDNGMRPKFEAIEDLEFPIDKDFYTAANNKESYFYESIKDDFFAPGWIDFYPGVDYIIENASDNYSPDWFGTSNLQKEYNSIMKASKSKYDAVNYALYVVLLNHIVSAVDAGFTAKAYNSRLLGKENSVWERVTLEQQYVFSGSEMSPGAALRLRF